MHTHTMNDGVCEFIAIMKADQRYISYHARLTHHGCEAIYGRGCVRAYIRIILQYSAGVVKNSVGESYSELNIET